MRKFSVVVFMLCLAALVLSGCAPKLYQPVDLNPAIKSGKLVQKTNNFNLLFDRSASMDELVAGMKRIDVAKTTTTQMGQTIPDIKLNAGLRQFGGNSGDRPQDLLYGMAPLNKDGYNKAVEGIRCAYGITPLDKTVLAAGEDLKPFPGKSAMIIVSDFEHLKNVDDLNPEAALANVAKLKREFGDNLCVYTVQVGAAKGGKELAEAMAKASGCGFAVNAAELATPQGMANFVERVFLEPAPVDAAKKAAALAPAAVAPSREGAVKAPAAAREAVASTLGNIYFDFDKSNIRPKEREILKEHAAWLTKNKDYKVLISGHCDERGTTEYNLALGERRAAETKKFLVSLGVEESRINTISFGKERPADPGHSEEAWAKNRRAEFDLSK